MPHDDDAREAKPETLSSADAITDAERLRSQKLEQLWESASSFHRAPCLKPSVSVGALGGLGIGTIRYLGGAGARAAFTWGSTVAGLLSATSWYTCRRAMYARMNSESSLIARMQQGDRDALREYHRILEEREAKAKASLDGDGSSGDWYKKP